MLTFSLNETLKMVTVTEIVFQINGVELPDAKGECLDHVIITIEYSKVCFN